MADAAAGRALQGGAGATGRELCHAPSSVPAERRAPRAEASARLSLGTGARDLPRVRDAQLTAL